MGGANSRQECLFMEAAKEGDLGLMKKIFRQGKNIHIDDIKDHGETSVHLACQYGHLEVLKFLAEELHADLECRDNDGETPLHWACYNGKLEVVKVLIEDYGVDIECENRYGETPLQLAHDQNKTEVVGFLNSFKARKEDEQRSELATTDDVSTGRTFSDPVEENTGDQIWKDSTEKHQSDTMRLSYSKALRKGKEKPRRIRLLMSGPFCTGKSSIVRSLQGEEFQPHYESTEGICIEKRQLGPKLTFQRAFVDWFQLQDKDELSKQESNDDLLEDAKERNLESFLSSQVQNDSLSNVTRQSGKASEGPKSEEPNEDTKEEKQSDDTISMSVWDFAGQVEYHNMHQMFFRSNCIYLLVLDLQTDDMDRIAKTEDMLVDAQKWLNAIVSSAGTDIGLVIVGTHADCFKTWKEAENRLVNLIKDLGKRVAPVEWDRVLVHAPRLVVDNQFGKGIPELRRTLQDLASSLLNSMEDVPLRWLRLHEELETIDLDDNHFCVSLSHVAKRARKIGIVSKNELVAALLYFDQSGDIVYLASDELRDWVFPQPQLLLNAMRPLLAPPKETEWQTTTQQMDQKLLEEEGYLSNTALETLWKECRFENRSQLRDTLSASGLIMDFGRGVVVPSRLPNRKVRPLGKVGEHEIVVETYCTTHLPPSLFSYVLATMHRDHGMRDRQDLAMISRNSSCLALVVPSVIDGIDTSLFEFRAMLSVNKLSHSILIIIQAAPIDGEPEPTIKKCLAGVCLLLISTLHNSVKQRYEELDLSSWCRTTNGCNNGVPEWCILETKVSDDGRPSPKTEFVCNFGCRYSLSNTVAAVDGNRNDPNDRPVDPIFTRGLFKDGLEEDVGQLTHDSVSDPHTVWSCELKKPYIFLSHRGDDTKEIIARPTYWFLTKVLKIKTFFDNETMNPSDSMVHSLMEPAYRCNHALILLSPRFRDSKYCVRELNTFMVRYKNKQNISVIPALWQLENVEGYAHVLRNINWLKPGTSDPAAYMIDKLWPFLVKTFADDRNSFKKEDLVKFLIDYVEQIPVSRKTPASLDEFVQHNK